MSPVQRPNFTVQIPSTAKEWVSVMAVIGSAVIPVLGGVYAAWQSLTTQNAQHDQRLAIIERTTASTEQRVFRLEDNLIGRGNAKAAALPLANPDECLLPVPGLPQIAAEWDCQ